MANRKQQYGGLLHRKRYTSNAIQRARGTTYFDFLRKLSDQELQEEYRYIYSHNGDDKRKRIINQFLVENNKLELIR